MSLYAQIENGAVIATVSEYTIRQNNPNTTFPEVFVPPEGFLPLITAPIPDYNKETETYAAGPITIDGDHCTQTWVITASTVDLETARADKLGRLKAKRDQLEMSGFTYLGKKFDSGIISAMRISFAVTRAQLDPSYTTTWITADNSTIDLDASQIIGMSTALANASGQIFTYAAQLKAQINAATNLVELAAVDITAGWPSV